MIILINVENDSNSPYINLAMEEYFLKNNSIDEDIFILWQNAPTVVIGKNQNAYEELNMNYIENNKINVARRMSGGGAVYHDLGNINFTIIKNNAGMYKNDFSFFAIPIIKTLKKLGVGANFNGRNDIEIQGKKFSGNAQYFYRNKILHHGTLLFSSDLEVVSKSLNVNKEKYVSKGIQSTRSRVTNICDFINEPPTQQYFRKMLLETMGEEKGTNLVNYRLSTIDKDEINRLHDDKYSKWSWIFGKSPKMNYRNKAKFSFGTVELHMEVENGYIKEIKIYGDFFEKQDIVLLENKIIGKQLNIDTKNLLNSIDVSEYVYGMNNENFMQLFINS